MSTAAHVLFPIETSNRELDARLMLAVRLAAPGRRFFLGSVRRINRLAPHVSTGVYLGHYALTQRKWHEHAYQGFKRRNFALVFLHEEGAIFAGKEDSWRADLDRQIAGIRGKLAKDDWIAVWGEFQGAHFRERLPEMAA